MKKQYQEYGKIMSRVCFDNVNVYIVIYIIDNVYVYS